MNSFKVCIPAVALSGAMVLSCASPVSGRDQDAAKESGERTEILFDFSGEEAGKNWVTVNDNVMGGRSKGGFALVGKRLVFAGATNTNGGGFSSIRSRGAKLDLANSDGVIIRFRGDGRTYKFGARMSRSSAAYRADFETNADNGEWQVVRIPFSDLAPSWRGRKLSKSRYPLKKERIESIGLMIYDKQDGPFRLEVDWIKGYANK